MSFASDVQRRWYGRPGWLLLLWPLEIIFRAIVALRRCLYRWNILTSWRLPVPVIVVGNIAVGGTGKTPLTIALCEMLQRAKYKPGVVSRGYGAEPPRFPYRVQADDNAQHCGDEPLLIARRTRCPVVIAPERAAAARYLLDHAECDVIICDDGLQHYALQRDVEIVVIDASRRFGNEHCLPCGPLRESIARLNAVDAIAINGAADSEDTQTFNAPTFALELQPSAMVQLSTAQAIPPRTWCRQHRRVHAVAGIGNPSRFFATLRALGCDPIEHAFPDHHRFNAEDLMFDDALPIVMTEKDAVKCAAFANDRHWYLQVRAQVPESLASAILAKLQSIRTARTASPFN